MELLYILLVLLLVTRLFGELAVRIGQPPLVGELLSGIALGMLVHHFSGTFPVLADLAEDKTFNALTDLAIFFLMLLAGIEMHPREFARASRGALFISIGGMIVPMAIGFGVSWIYIPESEYKFAQSLFIATALSITAVPVAVKILMDLGRLKSRTGQIIVSAAIFDDVLSLLLLAVLTAVINTEEFPGAGQLAILVGNMVLFFVITGLIGRYIFPLWGRFLKHLLSEEIDFTGLLVAALAYALLAEALGMHFIIGAFVGGLFFIGPTINEEVYRAVKTKLTGITQGFLAPLFFASIGMHLQSDAIAAIPGFVAVVTIAALLGKLVGAGLPAYWLGHSARESCGIGAGMSARGAVELIIADIALRAGLFLKPQPVPPVVDYMFSAIVVMALVTTVIAPPLLKALLTEKDSR